MAKLIYSAIASLDGYVEDEDGKFDWAEPDAEVHAFVNDRAGLVDEIHLFLAPVLVGGGKHALSVGVGLKLELLDERRFGSGTVFLRYRTAASGRRADGNG
jgi:dihydrofolate reductase